MCSRLLVRLLSAITVAAIMSTPLTAQVHFSKAMLYNAGGLGARSVAIADLNGDGKMDLVLTTGCLYVQFCTTPGQIAVLLGNGDGTFQPEVTYNAGAYDADSVAVGDVNGDGIPDLVVADYCQRIEYQQCVGDGEINVLFGNGDGTFQPPVTYDSGGVGAQGVAIGDVNGDGIPDLLVTDFCVVTGQSCSNGAIGVLLGNGNGTFKPVVLYNPGGYYPDSVAIADVNSDGIPDLVVANRCSDFNCGGPNGNGEVGVLLGNGDGTFRPPLVYDSGSSSTGSVVVEDLRGNGIRDVVVSNIVVGPQIDEAAVLLGNGDGTFQPAVSFTAVGRGADSVAIGDVDGDGIPDLVMADGCEYIGWDASCKGSGQVNVLLGNGDGTFQAPVVYRSLGHQASGVAIADLNHDGRPDIVVTNACGSDSSCTSGQGTVAVLLNKTSYKTTTVLTSSPNPSKVNQTVTLTATVTSKTAVPNGEVVTFSVGTTKLGTGKTTHGVATLTTSFSKANTYTVKARYPGDVWHKPSYGTVSQVVNP